MSADLHTLHAYAATGDPEALSALVERYQDMVYAVCARILGNAHEAEDAAQDCFMALARNAAKVHTSPGAWLHRRATHRSLNVAKRRAAASPSSRAPTPSTGPPPRSAPVPGGPGAGGRAHQRGDFRSIRGGSEVAQRGEWVLVP